MAHICMVLRGDIRYDGRVRKEIGTLVRAGHQVELVVSDFNHIRSGGEDLDIKIHYVPITLRRYAAYNFIGQLRFNWQAAHTVETVGPTHIHCHDLSSLLAGVWAKRTTGARLVYDAHELMPETMGGIKKRIWEYIEQRCLQSCDGTIMPEKHRIAYFQQKYPGVLAPLLLENFPRRQDIPAQTHDLFRDIFPIQKEQRIILYSGIVGRRRHIEDLVESMTLCSEEYVLVILGKSYTGYEAVLQAKIDQAGLTRRVFLHDAVPHTEILRYMASCDIGTAFYRNTNLNNYYCASNKLYEYIALEKAVITNNYPGLLAAVEQYQQGVCLAHVTPEALAAAYRRAHDPNLVTPGVKKFFWEDEEEVLLQLYRD